MGVEETRPLLLTTAQEGLFALARNPKTEYTTIQRYCIDNFDMPEGLDGQTWCLPHFIDKGETPLQAALKAAKETVGLTEVVYPSKFLAQHLTPQSVNHQDADGNTALHLLVMLHGVLEDALDRELLNVDVAGSLIKARADLSLCNHERLQPHQMGQSLNVAAKTLECINYCCQDLLEKGISPRRTLEGTYLSLLGVSILLVKDSKGRSILGLAHEKKIRDPIDSDEFEDFVDFARRKFEEARLDHSIVNQHLATYRPIDTGSFMAWLKGGGAFLSASLLPSMTLPRHHGSDHHAAKFKLN